MDMEDETNQTVKRHKPGEKAPPLGKIEAQHFVRLRFSGDKAGNDCANLATKLWKTHVCKEVHPKGGDASGIDVQVYKTSLEEMLKDHKIQKPIFVRALRDSKGVPVFKPEWFKSYDENKPACVDTNGNPYFEVTEEIIREDLSTSRVGGQGRKRQRKRDREAAAAMAAGASNQQDTRGSAVRQGVSAQRDEAGATNQTSVQRPPRTGVFSRDTVSQSFSTESSTSTEFAPNITGKLGPESSESLSLHETLRDKIKGCKTAEDCVDVYEGAIFQECLRVFRRSKQQFVEAHATSQEQHMVDKWAQHWAEAMVKDLPWAEAIEHCRKTASRLLFKICNLWNFVGNDSPEDEQVLEKFGKRRIDHIMVHVLVLDRANSLYHMAVDLNDVPLVRGLCWYSTYDTEARAMTNPPMPPNSSNHSINKRYIWLHRKLYSREHDNAKAITRWVQIAFPPRLQSQFGPVMDPEGAKKARDAALDAEVLLTRLKRQEATRKRKEYDAAAPASLTQELCHIGSTAAPTPISPENQVQARLQHELDGTLPQRLPLEQQADVTHTALIQQQDTAQAQQQPVSPVTPNRGGQPPHQDPSSPSRWSLRPENKALDEMMAESLTFGNVSEYPDSSLNDNGGDDT